MKFSLHRGALEDSLATTKEFNNYDEFQALLGEMDFIKVKDNLEVSYYALDERCKQDLYMVLVDKKPIEFIYDLTARFLASIHYINNSNGGNG